MQPRHAGHPAAGEDETAQPLRGLERRPKPEERPEAEREEDAVCRRGARLAVDGLPVVQHPRPALRRVEPAQRAAGAAAGLMAARVTLQWEGQVCAIRRMCELVGHQFRLRREGAVRAELSEARHARVQQARARELARVKRIRPQRGQQTTQLRKRFVHGILTTDLHGPALSGNSSDAFISASQCRLVVFLRRNKTQKARRGNLFAPSVPFCGKSSAVHFPGGCGSGFAGAVAAAFCGAGGAGL